MKWPATLLLAVCALALQACATYTYEGRGYTSSDAGYYAEADYYGDDAYDEGYPLVDLSIVNARYYPWWSMDYYYLGNHYYRPYYFRPYYFGYSSGWYNSLGFLYSYPPYYAPWGFFGPRQFPGPYYAYYDPWYGWPPYGVGFNYLWYDTYWTRQYRDYHETQYPHHRNPVPDTVRYTRESLRDDLYPDRRDRAGTSFRSRSANEPNTTYRRISVAPASSDRAAMQVRSRSDSKIRESHIGPAPVTGPSVSRGPATEISIAPQQAPAAPVMSNPRVVRQALAPQARPSVVPPRSSPPPAAGTASPRMKVPARPTPPRTPPSSAASGPTKVHDSGSRRRN